MIYSDNTFDITNNIATYTRRDFKSVFDTTSNKWYMLNNLNAYEEYGIYGDSLSGTYYPGKLVIVNDHEYEWDGTEWDDLGEYVEVVTGAVRDANNKGYIKFPITVSNISSFAAKFKGTSPTTSWGGFIIMSDENLTKLSDNLDWRFFFATTNNLYYDVGSGRWNRSNLLNTVFNMLFAGNPMKLTDLNTGTVLKTASNVRPTGTTQNPYYLYFGNNYNENDYGTLYDLILYSDNAGQNAIAHYVPTIQNNVAGFYDTMNEVFIAPNGGTLGTETETRRPKDYPAKATPTISTLWASTIYRNSAHLTTLIRNDAEMVKIDYMSDDILKKGEALPTGPANDEIWYTTSDSQIIEFNSSFPTVVSNTYINEKGIVKFVSDVVRIGDSALGGLTRLLSISFPINVNYLGYYALSECNNLSSISYMGTVALWNAINKRHGWNYQVPATVVHCTDGDTPI